MKNFISRLRPLLNTNVSLICCVHVIACCVSLYCITSTDNFPGVISLDQVHLVPAIRNTLAFSPLILLFVYARFSFGFVIGFYLYTMIFGYLWLIEFSLLKYNHQLALISILSCALAFLIPSTLITKSLRQIFVIPVRFFYALPTAILVSSTAIIAIGSLYSLKLVDLSEMYKYRATLELPGPLRYAVWISSNCLLPFAFACFVTSNRNWQAALTLISMIAFYPIMLTKMALFAPIWLLALALLCRLTEVKIVSIVSFTLPILVGVIVFFLANAGVFPYKLGMLYFGTVNARMIATPSLALEVYNNYFAFHPLTHFCQINAVRLVFGCAYDQPIWAVMSEAYQLGAFNASLFATEGIASVGLGAAPISALVCGLIVAFGNRMSAGLPGRFVLLSAGVFPQVLTNVPLSTALLTNGCGLLFVLWFVTPRSAFSGPEINAQENLPQAAALK